MWNILRPTREQFITFAVFYSRSFILNIKTAITEDFLQDFEKKLPICFKKACQKMKNANEWIKQATATNNNRGDR